MNRIRNRLKSKIVLFNIFIVLPLSLIVYFYLPWRLKTFVVQERVKVLSPLNEQGIKLILETGHTLKASIATIQETVDSVQEIALSSKQQSLSTDQVSQTMMGINEGMKETATAATQTHKEAERLQILSHELQEMIHSYKV
jgi:methyl-accepting chemotaxis protein